MKHALVSLALASTVAAQPVTIPSEVFVAFRVDDTKAVAIISVDGDVPIESSAPFTKPVARFGFEYRDADRKMRDNVPSEILDAPAWLLHASGGAVFRTKPVRIVTGTAGCGNGVGVLLNVIDSDLDRFAALKDRYFGVERLSRMPAAVAAPTKVGQLPAPQLTASRRQELESLLNSLVKRDLPGIREESARDLAKAAESQNALDRSWAEQVQRADAALVAGKAKLTYDVQAFRLDPSGVPIWFVRAEWRVEGRQAFVIAAWIRAGDQLSTIESDNHGGTWLHMQEFREGITPEHLGLVLSVIDRDHDGWGEVLMLGTGYESFSIHSREYTADGFDVPDLQYSAGC